MSRNVRNAFFAATVAAGVLAPVGFSPAHAQDIVPHENRGVPQDWSHRHMIVRNVETMKEASGKGAVAFQRWKERLNNPRFTMAVAKKTFDAQPTANKALSGNQMAFASRLDRKPKKSSLTRDWSMPLGYGSNVASGAGVGTGVGRLARFPAKYTFDINATPSCTNDFIVYTTNTPGATSGTSALQTGAFADPFDFTNTTWGYVTGGSAQLTITNPNLPSPNSITLTARGVANATSNEGLNFYMGDAASGGGTSVSNSGMYFAYNLAKAINRNGNAVGVSAIFLGGQVTIIANQAGVAGNSITVSASPQLAAFFTLGGTTLTGGAATGVQPTLVAYNQLYKTQCQSGQVNAGAPNILWQYNTGNGAIADLSPVLSMDGTQVSFVQRTMTASGPTASLVLLKWAATGTTVSTPNEVAPASYRGCTAPCMTKFALGANNNNSSPFVDYWADVLFVGDNDGRLHRFDGVFKGTPQLASGWPVTVSAGNKLSSPVFDDASNRVFVGSDVSQRVNDTDTGTGGLLHSVNATTRAVVNSGQLSAFRSNTLSENVKTQGVRDAPVLDWLAQKVFVFVETDTSQACGASNPTNCKAVYQFTTTFTVGQIGPKTQIGRGQIPGRTQYIGQFDDMYWSSANSASPSGNMYICGSGRDSLGEAGAVSRRPTIWRIPITNGVMGTAVPMVEMTSAPAVGAIGASCSPVTLIKNGATEYLFSGVTANASLVTPGCTTGGGCIYQFSINTPAYVNYDMSTPPNQLAQSGTNKYMSVSSSLNLDASRTARETTVGSPMTYTNLVITQAPRTGTRNIVYTVMRGSTATGLTCTVDTANQTTCNGTGSESFLATDNISVRVARSGFGTGTTDVGTIRVQLSGTPAAPTLTLGAGLTAPGGTSAIIVDNVSATAGASQIYYSTLQRPGRAVQASQAGLN